MSVHGGWPQLFDAVLSFPFRNRGCPVLALLQGRAWCCLYHESCAQRLASHLRRSSPALYHLLLLRQIAISRSGRGRDRFLAILEQTRQRYRFVVVGYVVMPEHIHLLLTEPEMGTPSTVMQVLKQRTAYALLPRRKRQRSAAAQIVWRGTSTSLLAGALL